MVKVNRIDSPKDHFWLDIEKRVFLAFFDFYFWWFYPTRLHKAIRTTGNLLLGIHLLSVVVLGGILVKHVILQTVPIYSNDAIRDQIIKNTGRLDTIEENWRREVVFDAALIKDIGDLKTGISLLQQELTLYRWAFGLIFVVLVGQLGVAVFGGLMRREVERRELLPMTNNRREHDYREDRETYEDVR
jgi:hypothetical protein